jgi:hypothetical protein
MCKSLIELMPLSVPASRRWLLAQGVSVSRLDNALKSSKIAALGPGLYARPGLRVDWQGVVLALQRESFGVVVGGVSALEVMGKGHYLSSSTVKSVTVFASQPAPAWLKYVSSIVNVDWQGTSRVWHGVAELSQFMTQLYEWRVDIPALAVSRPERAMLEVLSLVPRRVSFELADNLFQGLTSLSPSRVNEALRTCSSVKAKRLFLWLAKRYEYPWCKRISVADYDLGSGKRVIAEGGKLDPDFFITVPEAFYESR